MDQQPYDFVTKQELADSLNQVRQDIVEPLQMIANSLGSIFQEIGSLNEVVTELSQLHHEGRSNIVDSQERMSRIEANQKAIVDKINEIPPTLYGGRQPGKTVLPLELPHSPESDT